MSTDKNDGWVTDHAPENVRGGSVWVHSKIDGKLTTVNRSFVIELWEKGDKRPWHPFITPPPYVEPLPTRWEGWLSTQNDENIRDLLSCDFAVVLAKRNGLSQSGNGDVHVREVRDGDITAEELRELSRVLSVAIAEIQTWTVSATMRRHLESVRAVAAELKEAQL